MKNNKLQKKVFMRTFGCQMNDKDSDIISSMLLDRGYSLTSSYDEADIILFNACSVRKHAEDRVWGKMGELKYLKKKGSIFGLVGCMGKVYGDKVFERLAHVNFVCGPANIYDIPDIIEKVTNGKRHLVATGREKRPLRVNIDTCCKNDVTASVNIAEGCDNFCSYCVVPHARGREVSRPIAHIIEEIEWLISSGIKEIMLLGQNVNSYGQETGGGPTHGGKSEFIRLLEKVNAIKGVERIRFMTSHPKDASSGLFKAMAGLDKVCRHLHLPMQSGSDKILKMMNRKYTVSHYLKLVESLKKEIPGCALTTDIIVGFPTETDKDFMDTYTYMKEIKFGNAFIFKYSPRPFTKAVKLKDDVPKEIKEERNQSLLPSVSLILTLETEPSKFLSALYITVELLSVVPFMQDAKISLNKEGTLLA